MTTAMSSVLHVKRFGATASIVLDRPPLNVLNLDALHELHDALDALSGEASIKVLQLRALGKAFCAGIDVGDHTVERAPEMLRVFNAVLLKLIEFPAPTVAVVQGPALGGGCELTLACDVVIADTNSLFGQPEIQLGSMPPLAMVLLPRMVGWQRAADLLFTGRTVAAEEAHRLGLVQYTVPPAELDDFANQYTRRMSNLSGPVLRLLKHGLLDARGGAVRDALSWCETLYRDRLLTLEDASEGIKAFMEKRKPVWQEA